MMKKFTTLPDGRHMIAEVTEEEMVGELHLSPRSEPTDGKGNFESVIDFSGGPMTKPPKASGT